MCPTIPPLPKEGDKDGAQKASKRQLFFDLAYETQRASAKAYASIDPAKFKGGKEAIDGKLSDIGQKLFDLMESNKDVSTELREKIVTLANEYPAIKKKFDELTALGEQYIASTHIHRREGTPRFIDKMPNNFRHIGLIHLMLPNARIIDARRDPLACGFSVFKQLFAQGQDFSYDLGHIGRYYADYLRLMAHWDAVLPAGRVLRVQHEDVIDDLEGQVRRILDYCGLPFEQSCVEFHRTERAVRTPSSEQVRRPINRDGTEVWKNYEPWLGPLKAALAGQSSPSGGGGSPQGD